MTGETDLSTVHRDRHVNTHIHTKQSGAESADGEPALTEIFCLFVCFVRVSLKSLLRSDADVVLSLFLSDTHHCDFVTAS